jgi:hypothetical protein
VFATAGCYLAAALVLGALGLAFTGAGTVAMWDAAPGWYHAVSLLLVLPYAWLGGTLRERELARRGAFRWPASGWCDAEHRSHAPGTAEAGAGPARHPAPPSNGPPGASAMMEQGNQSTTPAARVRRAAAGVALLSGALASAVAPAPAAAQGSSGDGFLFRRPIGSFTVRGGFDRARAGSDVFDFATDQLTLSRGDFGAFSVGADLAFRIGARADLGVGVAFAGSEASSEFRRFVDQDDQPIEQSTVLRRVPVTATLKAYLTPRGRSIGRYAWVPARYAPYVAAGGGVMWSRFRQEGDFVDFETTDVFPDRLTSTSWTPTAHGAAGIDYSLSPRFALTGEGRYTWARADLSGDFAGFDPIDLSGVSATVGLSVRF